MPKSFTNTTPIIELDPSFKPGMDVLGNKSPIESDSWRADEWVLLGVKVAHDAGDAVWFVRVSSLQLQSENRPPRTREFVVPLGLGGVKTGAKFTAPTGRILLETYDQNGMLLRSSVRSVPRIESQLTMLDILGANSTAKAASASEEMAGAVTLLQLLGSARALTPIREAVREHIIQKPSLLGIMFAGFRLNVETPIASRETIRASRPGASEQENRTQAKFPLLLSGQRLFDCRLVVAPVNPSTGLIAGTTLIEAVHPEHSNRRLTICALAAKSWSANPAIAPELADKRVSR